MSYILIMEYYSGFNRKQFEIHAMTCMNHEDMLSEISHSQKDKFYVSDSTYMACRVQSKSQKVKGLPWLREGRNGELLFSECRLSVQQDQDVLEIFCTIMLTYLLDCTLKMIKMVNYMLCVLYHNENVLNNKIKIIQPSPLFFF